MNIGERIKQLREARELSQKELAMSINMDQSQYSKIEKGKTDPTTSTLEKISKALGINVAKLFTSNNPLEEVDSINKSTMEKVQLLEQLEEDEKQSVFKIIDGLVSKKKLKDTLSSALKTA